MPALHPVSSYLDLTPSASPRYASPLSLLLFALSDMSQDSSDEDSEEEEDFTRVQFGSRYTAAWCLCLCVRACSAIGPAACASGPKRLDTNGAQTHKDRVVKETPGSFIFSSALILFDIAGLDIRNSALCWEVLNPGWY